MPKFNLVLKATIPEETDLIVSTFEAKDVPSAMRKGRREAKRLGYKHGARFETIPADPVDSFTL